MADASLAQAIDGGLWRDELLAAAGTRLDAPEDCEDVVQTTYLECWKRCAKRGCDDVRDPKSYLFMTMWREVSRFRKKQNGYERGPLPYEAH